ncbi:hypothetical protein POV27_18585 [Aureisphaera galaxeae]|uniref:hypothetical protein n=1 Tax=Aureisphaera galaxeae TaxID=1538023 RepID=UPI0023500137|nr:hypothetical protein [Aureisphaera galaxeae]MDC8006066.1 hypothetical protein [Aureisphaera galaxeae]
MKARITYITVMTLMMVTAISFGQEGVNTSATQIHDNSSEVVAVQKADNNDSREFAAAELINYQAVARNAGGGLIINTAVTVDFEIRDGAGGGAVFNETQNPTTDANGVFSVQVGSVNSLASVNWLGIEPWLHVTLNGTAVGETAIGSVATALHSKQSAQVMIYGGGTTNPDKMIAQHSPGFPGWGIGYADVGDDVLFMAGGTANMSIDLATGNTTTSGYYESTLTTDSPAANRIYGNSTAIAYGSIDSLGGISTGYGIASVNNSATGVYEITLDLDSNPANTIVTITPFTIGFGVPEIAGYETTGANTFTVRIQDASGTARDSAFSFVVYPQ